MDRCFNCGQPAQHQHHVVPKSMGGESTVPLCEECHSKIHGVDLKTSNLTKSALEKRKKAGVLLGMHSPNHDVKFIQTLAVRSLQDKARSRAEELKDILHKLSSYGLSQRMIASVLSFMCVPPPRKGTWSQATVQRMLKRIHLS